MIHVTISIQNALILTVFGLVFAMDGIFSFQSPGVIFSSPRALRSLSLYSEKSSSPENSSRKDQQENEEFLFGSVDCVDDIPSDNQISSSLNQKIKELELGIGKRYIIRTQRGFLNVHYEVRRHYQFAAIIYCKFVFLELPANDELVVFFWYYN